jgi:peroxiredoxin
MKKSASTRKLSDLYLRSLRNPRRWYVLMLIVLLSGILWIWISSVPATAMADGLAPSPREGFSAPDFTLELLGGGEVTLSSLRGQVVVINLWASWCPPCRAEMPAIQAVYERNRSRGLEVLAVNTTFQDREAAAEAFVQEFGLTFPIPLDLTGEVSRQYQLRALPSTFFIDREGVIRKVVIGGPMSETTIQTAVEDLLGGGS